MDLWIWLKYVKDINMLVKLKSFMILLDFQSKTII